MRVEQSKAMATNICFSMTNKIGSTSLRCELVEIVESVIHSFLQRKK